MLNQTVTVGRVAGVPIRVHWSWPPITIALLAILAELYSRDARVREPLVAAALGTALLSLSLLLHELAHALVARQVGMQVHGIAVFALGGVTEIADEGITAGRELLVAFAGPALNLVLALLATLAWRFELGPPAVVAHVALANWALTIFNLLPCHPLDGGRALKAALWFLSGHELGASHAAAWAARISGFVILTIGWAYALVTADFLNAAWLLVVGFFLTSNAMTGHRRLLLQRALRNVTAADLMRRSYRAVTPELHLDEFVGRYVLSPADQGFPVIASADLDAPQRLLGMMTLRNLRRFTLSRWPSIEVGQAMTPAHRVRLLAPDTPAGETLRALLESGEELLPVVEGEILSGVVLRGDVVSFIQRKIAAR